MKRRCLNLLFKLSIFLPLFIRVRLYELHLEDYDHDTEPITQAATAKNIEEELIPYTGRWKAEDMEFIQLWNNDCYEPEQRNYTRHMMVFHTPAYKHSTDVDESISLEVNVEEGIVFLNPYYEAKAKKIFVDENEVNLFIQRAQKMFDEELDMGQEGSRFIYGYGGTQAVLMEHNNPNIQYLPIIFPDNEKFRNPRYREKVERSLIQKGAINIIPQEGEAYLAVIQRKNKPRDLKPFLKYLPNVRV